MLRISKKVEYALISLLHMSRKSNGHLTTARELAQTYQIPPELMGKVLQQLTKSGFIESVQGMKGGYRLNKLLDQMSLVSVFSAVDGPIKIVSCLKKSQDNPQCHQTYHCTIKSPMEIIQKKLEKIFSELSLRDIENDLAGL